MIKLKTRHWVSVAVWSFVILVTVLTATKVMAILSARQNEKPLPPEIMQVGGQKILPSNIYQWVWGEGNAFSVKREFLRFEVPGRVVKLAEDITNKTLREGSHVKAGQILAEVDPRDYIQARKQCEADIIEAENGIKIAEAEVIRTKTELIIRIKQFKRAKKLTEKKVLSLQKLEMAEDNLNTAKSSARTAIAKFNSAKSQLMELKARLKKAEIDLERTKIKAPFDGIIARLNLKIGDYASLNSIDSSSTFRLAMTTPIIIIDPSCYEVEIDLPAYLGKQVKEGQYAEIYSDILEPGQSTHPVIHGTVYSVSPAVSLAKRTIKVKIRTKDAEECLLNGESVLARIRVATRKNTIALPFHTLQFEDNVASVFVYNSSESTVHRRKVKIGIQEKDLVQICDGIKFGDIVIVKGQNKLTDGEKVQILTEQANR